MRIVLLASGSRGDAQPYVALGVGLIKKGHEVCIATAENFKEYVTSYGLDFYAIQGDISKVMNRAEIESQMKAKNPISFILSFNEMNKTFRKDLDEGQEKAWEASQNADDIIFHPGLMNGYYISKKLGIPGILASPIPFSPTSEYPALLFYNGQIKYIREKEDEKEAAASAAVAVEEEEEATAAEIAAAEAKL